jgi:peptidoglycan/xylan/chitin deacetylase (PgdA/CDA1 family)
MLHDPDSRAVCLTVDVEWAHPEVLADLVHAFDERGLRATFFCTHDGVDVGDHERGLHPNLQTRGDVYATCAGDDPESFAALPLAERLAKLLAATKAFAPEAVGARSHCLRFETAMIRAYRDLGMEYDCSYFMPLVEGLRPFWREYEFVQVPTYYIDHGDLKAGLTGFRLEALGLERPGVKVFDFHPNMVFLNCEDDARYQRTRPIYHDPEALLAERHGGRGVRTLFHELLDHLADGPYPVRTVAEVAGEFRAHAAP